MARKINERLKITVIGCGACGNSITAAIEEKIRELGGDKANTTFIGINTSTEDLASVNLSHKIHINNSKGAACNRENSIQDLAESIDTILEELKSYIIEDSIVFIATSLGGGTGSAIAPMLAEILLDEGYTVGMIAVLPADNESLKIKDNARQAFYEIEELKPRMGSIFILDNNATEKMTVNKIFASLFTAWISHGAGFMTQIIFPNEISSLITGIIVYFSGLTIFAIRIFKNIRQKRFNKKQKKIVKEGK